MKKKCQWILEVENSGQGSCLAAFGTIWHGFDTVWHGFDTVWHSLAQYWRRCRNSVPAGGTSLVSSSPNLKKSRPLRYSHDSAPGGPTKSRNLKKYVFKRRFVQMMHTDIAGMFPDQLRPHSVRNMSPVETSPKTFTFSTFIYLFWNNLFLQKDKGATLSSYNSVHLPEIHF